MFDQFSEVHVSPEQGEVIARGLYALSRVDGHEAREGMLIKSLWLDTMTSSRGIDLKALEMGSDVTVEQLAKQLRNPELRVVFLMSAIMLTYADGSVSKEEKDWLASCAKAFNVSEEEMMRYDDVVKSQLMSELSHIVNTDATRAVAKKLGY